MSNFRFIDPWHAMFPAEGGHIVAFSGSGGKTSLLAAAAAVYSAAGVPCVATTTTRTEALDWPGLRVCEYSDLEGADGLMSPPTGGEKFFLRAGVEPDGKWRGLEAAQVDRVGVIWPGAVLLVEADGSAKLPLKLYREDEPCWPRRTSLAVVVMGLGALAEDPAEVVHRYGKLPHPVGIADCDAVDWDFLFTLLTGPGGYLAQLPTSVPPVLALTQLDLCDDSIGLFAWLGRVMDEADLPLVLLCTLGGGQPEIRAVCRRDSSDGGGSR